MMMIDNPVTAMDLLDKLNAVLPMPTRLTPETQALLRKQIKSAEIPSSCRVTWLYYMGDEGGILCKLDLALDTDNEAFVSITHLRFDARLPLARAITAYQKHRMKRLQRQHA